MLTLAQLIYSLFFNDPAIMRLLLPPQRGIAMTVLSMRHCEEERRSNLIHVMCKLFKECTPC